MDWYMNYMCIYINYYNIHSMHKMLFRARVLGSKELNRGHVAQNNKNETFFVSLIPSESSACTGCVCQYNLRDKITTFRSS